MLAICLVSGISLRAQQRPDEIRGYKVYRQKIEVTSTQQPAGGADKNGVYVVAGKPEIADVSLAGITLAIPAEFDPGKQSGEVEFISFRDFRVNDLPVEIREYGRPFRFRKNERTILPQPAEVFLPASRILNAAFKEMKGSKKTWAVTGRVFVFGRFRKLGFTFKRVVVIDVSLAIDNPLRDLR